MLWIFAKFLTGIKTTKTSDRNKNYKNISFFQCIVKFNLIPQLKIIFFLNSIFQSALVEWNKLDSDIRKSPSYSSFKKKVLNFIRPHSNNVFNASHPKGVIFLTRLRVGFSYLRELKFKHSFLDTLNPICTCGFYTQTLHHFFLHCPRFTNKRQNSLLKIEMIIPTFREKLFNTFLCRSEFFSWS